MNRRSFVSLLAGTAGAGLVLWSVPKPIIFLPSTEIVTVDASWLAWTELECIRNFDQMVQKALVDTLAIAARMPIRYLHSIEEVHEFFGPEDA
jgi:hypothetical protein